MADLAALWLSGKPHLLLLSGISGSGKTYRAMQWQGELSKERVRVNYDDLRLALYGPDWKFNLPEEKAMKHKADEIAIAALDAGKSVVVDNTNLTPRARAHWEAIAQQNGAKVLYEEVDTPIEVCKKRDEKREGNARVGWAVIDRQALFNGFVDWEDRNVYTRNFIVVDMDGTLADCEWRRKFLKPKLHHKMDCTWYHSHKDEPQPPKCPQCLMKARKDWASFFRGCGEDPPNTPVVRLTKLLSREFDVIIVSGRPLDQCGKATEEWLRKYLTFIDGPRVHPIHLFMRNSGDNRSDVDVKQEILDLLPKERIAYVLDDRDQVVEMWRKNGLCCLQVAEGKF